MCHYTSDAEPAGTLGRGVSAGQRYWPDTQLNQKEEMALSTMAK